MALPLREDQPLTVREAVEQIHEYVRQTGASLDDATEQLWPALRSRFSSETLDVLARQGLLRRANDRWSQLRYSSITIPPLITLDVEERNEELGDPPLIDITYTETRYLTPDGRQKRVGEMTAEELDYSCARDTVEIDGLTASREFKQAVAAAIRACGVRCADELPYPVKAALQARAPQ